MTNLIESYFDRQMRNRSGLIVQKCCISTIAANQIKNALRLAEIAEPVAAGIGKVEGACPKVGVLLNEAEGQIKNVTKIEAPIAEQIGEIKNIAQECPASCPNQYEQLKHALKVEQFTSIIKCTKHGLERLMERFSPEELKALYHTPDFIKVQQDGANAFIKQIENNKYNIMVYNQQKEAVVTAMNGVSHKDLINLGKSMDGNSNNKSGLLCCFCNENIEIDTINPCDINILTNWDKPREKQKNQTFWCHLDCFRKKLHMDMQKHLVVDLLSCDAD